MKTERPRNIRKLSDEDKRNVRETIADRLAAGEVTLSEAVRLMRLAVGMTQANYAKMVGVDIRVLIDVEKGQGNPRLDSLEKIAKPYGLAVSLVKLAPRSTGVVITRELEGCSSVCVTTQAAPRCHLDIT